MPGINFDAVKDMRSVTKSDKRERKFFKNHNKIYTSVKSSQSCTEHLSNIFLCITANSSAALSHSLFIIVIRFAQDRKCLYPACHLGGGHCARSFVRILQVVVSKLSFC
jgi:hypothetical protein